MSSQPPPFLHCPFCEKEVEIVTLQRDQVNTNVCIVVYFHPDGDQHFIRYEPKTYEAANHEYIP